MCVSGFNCKEVCGTTDDGCEVVLLMLVVSIARYLLHPGPANTSVTVIVSPSEEDCMTQKVHKVLMYHPSLVLVP